MIKVASLGATVVSFRKTTYPSNNATAVLARLQYEDGDDDEEFAVSVNLDHADNLYASRSLQPDEFCCKNWSEGVDIYEALVKAEWLVPTGAAMRSGFVRPPVCKIGSKAIVV